jgi:hypothetical protein
VKPLKRLHLFDYSELNESNSTIVLAFNPPGPTGGGGGGGGGFTIGSSSSSPPSLKIGSSLQLNAATEIKRTNTYLRNFIALKI